MLARRKGFTLIEIVIVLAIAALIMVIVFVAVQGANRARRDTSRKNDANTVLAQAEQWASNNNGDYPAALAGPPVFATNPVTTAGNNPYNLPVRDPNGNTYVYNYATTAPAVNNISVSRNSDCTGGTPGNRVFAVRAFQESGGVYCVDNR